MCILVERMNGSFSLLFSYLLVLIFAGNEEELGSATPCEKGVNILGISISIYHLHKIGIIWFVFPMLCSQVKVAHEMRYLTIYFAYNLYRDFSI